MSALLPSSGFRVTLLVWLLSRTGAIAKPVLSLATAALFAWLAKLSPLLAAALGGIDQAQLTAGLTALLVVLLNAWTESHLTTANKVVQTALNLLPGAGVDVDGVIAQQTLQELGNHLPVVEAVVGLDLPTKLFGVQK